MTNIAPADWKAELVRRLNIDEGCRLSMYHDSVGVPTIGIGYNLQNENASYDLHCAGVSDPQDVIAGRASITQAQADNLLRNILQNYIVQTSALFPVGLFDTFNDPRKVALSNMGYNMGTGPDGFGGFHTTLNLIKLAQQFKNQSDLDSAHRCFTNAAGRLTQSGWYGQVGDRAKRIVSMIRNGVYVDATGDGSN